MVSGQKQGTWKYYDRFGRIAKIQNFKNDILHGEEKLFDSYGKLGLHRHFAMGVLVDTSKFYVTGNINSIEYRDSSGLLQGEFRVIVDGMLVQKGYYQDGRFHGTFKEFSEKSGQITQLYHFKVGQKSGTWVCFTEAGDTSKTETF